jgi:hypothetical protein
MVGASFFILCVRIFCSNSAASRSPAKPSGVVLGLDWDGAVSSLQAAGGRFGLDCVLGGLSRMFDVKVQGHVVIFFFSSRPFCNSTPTAGMNIHVLPDLIH